MNLLFTIPHYYELQPVNTGHGSLREDPQIRLQSLTSCITALHQLFGRPQCIIDHVERTTTPANQLTAERLDVVVCTTGNHHLLQYLALEPNYITHFPTRCDPWLLGFECHAILQQQLREYDYFCYLEDDLVLHDPWFFQKLAWFSRECGEQALLVPNRYEVTQNEIVHKAYIDGPLRPEVAAPFQDVSDAPLVAAEVMGTRVDFYRPLNPHSGAFFLSSGQMEQWASQPYFLNRDVRFVGPLESAATLGVMQTFRLYKPMPHNAGFLEIEHSGRQFVGQIRAVQ